MREIVKLFTFFSIIGSGPLIDRTSPLPFRLFISTSIILKVMKFEKVNLYPYFCESKGIRFKSNWLDGIRIKKERLQVDEYNTIRTKRSKIPLSTD